MISASPSVASSHRRRCALRTHACQRKELLDVTLSTYAWCRSGEIAPRCERHRRSRKVRLLQRIFLVVSWVVVQKDLSLSPMLCVHSRPCLRNILQPMMNEERNVNATNSQCETSCFSHLGGRQQPQWSCLSPWPIELVMHETHRHMCRFR